MKKIGLSDITQEDFDAAAEVVSSGIRAFNRKLDTRAGTVLRDLLVDPESAIESVTSGQIEEARKSSSLKRLKDAQDAGEEIDQEDVEAILSNFNIVPSGGRRANGIVKVVVSDGTVAYGISEGEEFSTVDGISFAADNAVMAVPDSFPEGAYTATRIKLYEGAAGWFFLVPVTAVDEGTSGNVRQGTSLTPETPIASFVMADAYKDFDGGSNVQSIGSVIESIPSGLSIRGFVNKTAVEGMLRAEFDQGAYPVVAVSSVGCGNAAQIRDKHNVFGVGVGGRIDVYVRNFTDPFTITRSLNGTYLGNGEYSIVATREDFPGACWIKSVADPFGESMVEDALSPLSFSAVRTADVSGTWHDFDCSSSPVEAFNTVWQGFAIHVIEVPPDIIPEDPTAGEPGWSETREFKVTAYCMPQAVELQEFVDRDDVRSVSTDVVVRCPVVCGVSVNAIATYDSKNPVDKALATAKIRDYVNGLGFVGRVTRSEIVQILKNLGAVSVEMQNKDMLYGELHDANGTRHVLSGDAIDVTTIADGHSMLTSDTVVFCAEEKNVQLKLTPSR